MRFRAISSKQLRQAAGRAPADAQGAPAGANYNVDTFAPALISEVSLSPKLTYEQAAELYHSDDWRRRGDATLFLNAPAVCNQGLDVPFSARD